MTKQELVNMYYKLDRDKFKLMEKGVAFNLVITENGGFLHTGIGTGEDMSMINLYSLLSLYVSACKEGATIEGYAESVKQGIIKAYYDNMFDIEGNDEHKTED